jgi:hypothetical protein
MLLKQPLGRSGDGEKGVDPLAITANVSVDAVLPCLGFERRAWAASSMQTVGRV